MGTSGTYSWGALFYLIVCVMRLHVLLSLESFMFVLLVYNGVAISTAMDT